MKPKTKPEPRMQIKFSVPKSTADAFDATRKQADELGFDWNGTMVEQLEKTNSEFSQFLARHRAKTQPNAGLTASHRVNTSNGADPESA
jgi:dsDNA-binding SOS-regulon protein